ILAAGTLRAADPAKAADAEKAAESSAQSWLAMVDAGKYGESWDAAAALFKGAMSRSQWEGALEKVRRPLGKVVSRKLRGAKFMTELPNAPAGEYVVIQYDTEFENRPGATETITPMKDKDGAWRVSGYFIK
ncbi:MAG: DUF4019 domain-containing protein, partial [Syntrophomonadaceae bacterium]